MAFEHPIRVYWEDTDAGGIVFHANHLKFFERARTEWLRSLGLSQRRIRQQTGGMFVVAETALKYHAPARLDDLLTVSTDLQRKGAASLVLAQKTLLRSERAALVDATLLCAGTIRIGWVDCRTLTPARIPQMILEVFQ